MKYEGYICLVLSCILTKLKGTKLFIDLYLGRITILRIIDCQKLLALI